MARRSKVQIIHHGAVNGVTGSCHQLDINAKSSVLIDCGLFQGAETAGRTNAQRLEVEFELAHITALLVTHCHIDHVGRIPYLLAAGFDKPIYATTATAALLPIVIADALKVGVTKNKRLINLYLKKLQQLIIPIDYNVWFPLQVTACHSLADSDSESVSKLELVSSHSHGSQSQFNSSQFKHARAKFRPAGHILGSAYIEIELKGLINQPENASTSNPKPQSKLINTHRVVFSGDLGAPYTPLLPSPKSPYRADTLIIESTYGDTNHQARKQRSQSLRKVIEKSVSDNGVVLIPAFSIGRTQELLYELEQIIHRQSSSPLWQNIEIIVDSPLAATFTEQYQSFKQLWDSEARKALKQHRHPLDFEQLYTVNDHKEHLATIDYLAKRNKPAIIIAASGMCSGGRIMNYLERFLAEPTADVIFVGYQAKGTPGRDIQQYGPAGGYVDINGSRIDIKAGIHTISGYSAHADQNNLINFVKRMQHRPKHIRIVHGDPEAKEALANKYRELLPEAEIEIGGLR
ncbi:MBL fold metallo-hydrolase [Shewanella eurypsychrophilus]|uniref:MBL fold metallo-hydrolase n=1 Tax=Shewanella eurypsychrophilus TaxID=2593656 RepID=A0ABX6V8D3_9GAMM|nr:MULTISPECIES: MBL fold metallo-hydrolase [Shewanella]QFU23458.1 MBL fold metallo-hydrolase [Shewanella sp. YLB-09]QPG58687.1 MBL fold metallo-hydrolase [Shewanella eurypsychrophilus]